MGYKFYRDVTSDKVVVVDFEHDEAFFFSDDEDAHMNDNLMYDDFVNVLRKRAENPNNIRCFSAFGRILD